VTWGPDPQGRIQATVEVLPKPCCKKHDDAIYAAFAKAAGAIPPS
jgi:hypothetical protein